MRLKRYINEYGEYSFEEKEINEIDKTIFSFISYINLQGISLNKKITFNEMYYLKEKKNLKNNKNIIAEKDALKILRYIKDKKRYKDCILYNYIYEVDNEYQFSAITIEYLKNNIYISFEGTDEMISSWYEDFLLSYKYTTRSHIEAKRYLNKYLFTNKKIILGGHSKGGNIALVSALNSNILIRSKIKEIYSMDGPGLLPEIIKSNKYKRIEKKYTHIVPENSFVGMLLENTNEVVVKTKISGVLAHDILYWDVEDNKFTREKLSYFSKNLRDNLNKYIYSLSKEELETIINNFGLVCERIKVKSIIEFGENNKKILELLKELKHLDEKAKVLLFHLIEIIIKSYKESISKRINEKINKLKESILG